MNKDEDDTLPKYSISDKGLKSYPVKMVESFNFSNSNQLSNNNVSQNEIILIEKQHEKVKYIFKKNNSGKNISEFNYNTGKFDFIQNNLSVKEKISNQNNFENNDLNDDTTIRNINISTNNNQNNYNNQNNDNDLTYKNRDLNYNQTAQSIENKFNNLSVIDSIKTII